MSASVVDPEAIHNVNQENVRDMSNRKKNLMLELNNLEEATKPSVEMKIDEFGNTSTGIPVSLKYFI